MAAAATTRENGTRTSHISLLDIDRDFGQDIPAADRPAARAALIGPAADVAVGPWERFAGLARHRSFVAVVVVDGILLRTVSVAGRTLPELLGPGAVIDPPPEVGGSVPYEASVDVLAPARVMVLGESFVRACHEFPCVLGALQRRRARQHVRAALHGAIATFPNVQTRILATLWHIADDWGRVSAGGVVLPFAFSHDVLGWFVGARRPTVSLAVKDLERAGLVWRTDDRSWVLAPGSDEHLHRHIEALGASSAAARARSLRVTGVEG